MGLLLTLTKLIVEIVNVVASDTIDQKLDLYRIQEKFPDVEYNPSTFPSAVLTTKPKIINAAFQYG